MNQPCTYQADLLKRLQPQLDRARKASYGWHSEAKKARDRARYAAPQPPPQTAPDSGKEKIVVDKGGER